MLHLPSAVPVAGVIPLAVKAFLRGLQVEVLRHETWVNIDRSVFIEPRDIKGTVVHDIVKIDTDAKAVSHSNELEQFGFGAVASADRVALVFAA